MYHLFLGFFKEITKETLQMDAVGSSYWPTYTSSHPNTVKCKGKAVTDRPGRPIRR
jgi:hypothetical protein